MQYTITKSRDTYAGIHYTTKHGGKMKGVVSVSTDINSNPFCQARQGNPDCICAKCYAESMMDDTRGVYRRNNGPFKANTEILCGRLLTDEELPVINPAVFPLFRVQSFGDVRNVTECLNYFKMARRNPQVRFAFWTKNIAILAKAVAIAGKPENVQIVLSSERINEETDAAR